MATEWRNLRQRGLRLARIASCAAKRLPATADSRGRQGAQLPQLNHT